MDKKELNSKERRLLETEISILRDLRHKNLARCVDAIRGQSRVYIIMERIKGTELYDYLRQKKIFMGTVPPLTG